MQPTPPSPTAVLAYGTLRPGEGNHGLIEDLRPEATTVEVPGYALTTNGAFPYAVAALGEVTVATLLEFHPDDWPEALRRMDRLEGYPSHYGRRVTSCFRAGERLTGWLYVPSSDYAATRPRVPGNDWSAHVRGEVA
jgi:gamma-glutamylcyclotransferase (GGCT)/AIG2-like uncharacterized protein YtfP